LEETNYVFFVSGGDGPRNLYIALVDSQTGEELVRFSGKQDNTFERVHVDCSAWIGRDVRLRIVDQATGPWGHINFGGVYEDPMRLFSDD
jgi:hypothetical protein